MKRVITSFMMGVILLSLGLTVSISGTAEAGLFRDQGSEDQPQSGAGYTGGVLRQRTADIRWKAVEGCTSEFLELNLFGDVCLIAHRDRVEQGPENGCAWMGTILEPEQGEAIFVTEDGRLSGTVTLGSSRYTVRPQENGLHLIREIDRRVEEPSSAGDGMLATLPQEEQVVALVNDERAIEGLHPLTINTQLENAARGHSEDMATQNYFSHMSKDGRSPWDRIADAGYPCAYCGENIAAGYSTPEAVMNGWMNSPGHRANILDSAYCDIGVGYADNYASSYRIYWTQDFGREPGVASCSQVEEEYGITASASANGTITPSGRVEVTRGGNMTFTITPNEGCRIRTVLVDGMDVGVTDTYTFEDVRADHTIKAKFSKKPTISITAYDPNAGERPKHRGKFRLKRKGDPGTAVTVHYSVGGSATPGDDYKPLSGVVTIPGGASIVTIPLDPYNDAIPEDIETVIVTLDPDDSYILGSPFAATVTITSNE